jgi:hypothetical protein
MGPVTVGLAVPKTAARAAVRTPAAATVQPSPAAAPCINTRLDGIIVGLLYAR